jgi:hypothetical protein
VQPPELVAHLAVAIDATLAQQLIDEYMSLEETFLLRKWKHTELDGGRFVEVAARTIYSVDSRNVALTKSVDDCLRYIENTQVPHNFPEPQTTNHIGKVIRSVYKLRSQRGAVHVSPTYTANEIDSRLIVEAVRWIFAEVLRVFLVSDRELVADIVRSLARFPQPMIRLYEGIPLLQVTTFTAEEEVLAHLLHARSGMTTAELCKLIPKDRAGVARAVKKLASAGFRQIVERSGKWLISDLGITRIENRIASEARSR